MSVNGLNHTAVIISRDVALIHHLSASCKVRHYVRVFWVMRVKGERSVMMHVCVCKFKCLISLNHML